MQENEQKNGLEQDEGSKQCKTCGFAKKLDNFFEIEKRGSKISIEIFAGLATFLAMAYILTVNPSIITGGSSRWSSVFIATVFGAFVGTLLIAILARLPYAQAPGMGLNVMLATVIGTMGSAAIFNFNTAMLMVLISGILFLLISVIPLGRDKKTGKMISLREKAFDGVPKGIRTAIPVGIGLFIAYIGFQNAGIIQGDFGTVTTLVDFTAGVGDAAVKSAIVCFTGLVLITLLSKLKIKGAVILGMLGATILGAIIGVADINVLAGKGDVSWKFWENFSNYFKTDETGAFGAAFYNIDIGKDQIFTFIMLIITFAMIDMFDTMGTVVGCATNAGLIDIDGKPIGYDKVMYSDSIATVTGAVFGTSTVTTYVESGAGIAAGGKTGLTALVIAGLFLLSIFVMPLFAFIPSAAAASALIYVGVLMMSTVKNIDFTDPVNAVPAFLAIFIMPLAYSITDGIGIAILAHVVISIVLYLVNIIRFAAGKKQDKPKWPVSIVTGVVALLFCLYFFVPIGL